MTSEATASPPAAAPNAAAGRTQQGRLFHHSRDDRSLRTLLVSSQMAAALAPLIRADAPWPRGGLIVLAPQGGGKTHLVRAFLEAEGGRLLSPLAPLDDPDRLWSEGGGVVAMDDAERVADEAGLFRLLDGADMPGRRLLLASSFLPKLWPLAKRDLKSRLEALPRVLAPAPDEAFMAGLITRLCRLRFMKLDPAAADYLAKHTERTYPEAHRLVEALDALVSKGARPVSVAMAARALHLIRPQAPDPAADDVGQADADDVGPG
jgi:chromosomal replication initiation ATPase DnaA